nr:leptin-like [Nothobranchius furzeri]XP_054589614.1 leptin-like [Nothobranchius furzeri]
MDHTLVLLFSFFHVLRVGMGAPLRGDQLKVKVGKDADTLIIRLTQNFQMPPNLTLSPPSTELAGLASIVAILKGYNNLISDTFDGVAQVKSEISDLTNYINQWRLEHCRNQPSKPLVPTDSTTNVQHLQNQKRFVHTVSIVALMRVKEVLGQLRKNPDLLEIC